MKRLILLAAALALLLTACGQAGTQERISADPSTDQPPQPAIFDWQWGEWNTDLKEDTAYPLYLGRYIDGLLSESANAPYERQDTFYSVWGEHIYALDCFGLTLQDGGNIQLSYCLSHYEGKTGEISRQEFELPDIPDAAGLDKKAVAFDIVDERECVLFMQLKLGERVEKYLAVHLSVDGELLHMTDLYPAMVENGIFDSEGYIFDDIHADSERNYYLLSDKWQGELLVLGADGETVERLAVGRNSEDVRFSMKDPGGTPVFEWYDPREETLELVRYVFSSGMETYACVKIPPYMPRAMSPDGLLYYMDTDTKLYRWELGTGNVAYCADCKAMGLSANPALVSMTAGSDGLPLLLNHAGDDAAIYRMDTRQAAAQTVIRLVSTTPYCSYISSCASDFSRKQENTVLLIEKPQTEGMVAEEITRIQNEFRERALLEITSGSPADLYLISAEDMRILYEKGALADLTGILPPELEDCIFPGVLESGMIDGRQIGLTPEATVTIAMVSDELWTKGSWTFEEALDLWDSQPELDYLLISPGYNYGTGYLYHTFLRDPAHSPFLDLEKGTCNFVDSLFIRILEHIRDYRGYGSWEEDPLGEGRSAGFFATLVSYPYFTQLMAEYGEQYHPVGFPTQEGSGNYWNCDYFLVMSRDTPHREILQEYLTSLYEPERQRNSDHPIRNDLISRYTVSGQDGKLLYDMGDGVYSALGTKADGSSWEQEYLTLMDSCVYCSDETGDIVDIILEETEYYFTGGRDVEKTAEIIQNRVQVYLNERNN